MSEIVTLIDLAQAGGIATMLVISWLLWQRLNKLTDAFISYLEESARNGDTAARTALDVDERRGQRP